MSEATLIYPHQLFLEHPALAKERPVYLVEEPLFFTEFPTHTQKLLLHRLSMKAYEQRLIERGYTVTYISATEVKTTEEVFVHIARDGITTLHCVDTTDYWLEKRIEKVAQTHSYTFMRYESPLFMLAKADAVLRYKKSRKHMARFYKQLRIDTGILMHGIEPEGGEWSFDEDNRKKVPKHTVLPVDILPLHAPELDEARVWLSKLSVERYGDDMVWVPWTHEAAQAYLHAFLTDRFAHFGDFEDAIMEGHTRLFHSTLSPLLNIGLLTPREVVDAAILYGHDHAVPLNNIEGFVRQIIGWREFIRASYECDGTSMRRSNFWNNSGKLPETFWKGTTGIVPIDSAITRALRFGYTHHIERLMVLGSFMLLSTIHPDEVYRWFMAMYVDAYDWVMVPNVYGMSQFADGGSFATKPYISGSNYLMKMSDYPKGEWEELWTALYWNFIAQHEKFFAGNHRLSMMPRMLALMDIEKRTRYHEVASAYLKRVGN